jgi:hypothetical protein
LNAGTGIDALYFISKGHRVFATDVSDGMIAQLKTKQTNNNLENKLRIQQVSYDDLGKIDPDQKFDYIFSNFGGLNCTQDLSNVTSFFPSLLKREAYVTLVIMPKVCPYELVHVFKGNFKHAFRRFGKNGTRAHLEGAFFQTYYHSLTAIRSAFGKDFKFIQSEGLAALTPQPHMAAFPRKFPRIYRLLKNIDGTFGKHFPFDRWADHIIVTFRYLPQ